MLKSDFETEFHELMVQEASKHPVVTYLARMIILNPEINPVAEPTILKLVGGNYGLCPEDMDRVLDLSLKEAQVAYEQA